jgi:tRNA(Ile)-lysidine synthase
MDVNGDLILTPESTLKTVQNLSQAKILWVAFSGGLDSHVLLDLLVQATKNISDFKLGALHIHHGISDFADSWVQHCERVCLEYQIPLKILYVDGRVTDGRSPEAVAREARFAAFENFLGENEALLLAHHGADQAETILFRLFRGSGPLGLGGMRAKVALGKGELIRPLLEMPKDAILKYVEHRNLNWIEDDSNKDKRFDRNFLRHEVMPILNARWPHVVQSINRAGVLCFESAIAGESIAEQDIESVLGTEEGSLSVTKLLALSCIRRRGVIRYWLQRLGCALPSRDHMERIEREVLKAKSGAKPRLKIGLYEICRHKDDLVVKSE